MKKSNFNVQNRISDVISTLISQDDINTVTNSRLKRFRAYSVSRLMMLSFLSISRIIMTT